MLYVKDYNFFKLPQVYWSTILAAFELFLYFLIIESYSFKLENHDVLSYLLTFLLLALFAFLLMTSCSLIAYILLSAVFITYIICYSTYHFTGQSFSSAHIVLASQNVHQEVFNSIILFFYAPSLAVALIVASSYIYFLRRDRIYFRSIRSLLYIIIYLIIVLLLTYGIQKARLSVNLVSPFPSTMQAISELIIQKARELYYALPERKSVNAPSIDTGLNVVYIIGESIRADHLFINGYHRNTTPNIARIISTFPSINFSNVVSHGDCTNRSVPQLLIQPSFPAKKSISERPTLFSYAKNAGYKTGFFFNNRCACIIFWVY